MALLIARSCHKLEIEEAEFENKVNKINLKKLKKFRNEVKDE